MNTVILELGCGITNVVSRTTARADELTDEIDSFESDFQEKLKELKTLAQSLSKASDDCFSGLKGYSRV